VGVGFGLITLGIGAVRLDQFLGYGLSIGGFIFVTLSVLPDSIAELTRIFQKAHTPRIVSAQIPWKMIGSLLVTLGVGAYFLLSEATAPFVVATARGIYVTISNVLHGCSSDLPLSYYMKCKP